MNYRNASYTAKNEDSRVRIDMTTSLDVRSDTKSLAVSGGILRLTEGITSKVIIATNGFDNYRLLDKIMMYV